VVVWVETGKISPGPKPHRSGGTLGRKNKAIREKRVRTAVLTYGMPGEKRKCPRNIEAVDGGQQEKDQHDAREKKNAALSCEEEKREAPGVWWPPPKGCGGDSEMATKPQKTGEKGRVGTFTEKPGGCASYFLHGVRAEGGRGAVYYSHRREQKKKNTKGSVKSRDKEGGWR